MDWSGGPLNRLKGVIRNRSIQCKFIIRLVLFLTVVVVVVLVVVVVVVFVVVVVVVEFVIVPNQCKCIIKLILF